MTDKPDLIIFSQNLLGGGASFHRNMIANFPTDFFNIKCIYLDPSEWDGAKSLDVNVGKADAIFSYGSESPGLMAKRLSKLMPATEGAIVANLEQELIYIDIFRKQKKAVFFICHDAGFIPLAVKYQSVIDVFIAHNASVYQEISTIARAAGKEAYFIQHGVKTIQFSKPANENGVLRLVFLARHHAFKGIFDLPEINSLLIELGVQVAWTILGDGPDKPELVQRTKDLPNFTFTVPRTADDVIEVLKQQDVFILPSRNDGLPVALLEAMSVGCVPVIANFSEGIKNVVTEDIGFVLPIGNNELFAAKIAELNRDRFLLKRLSENCINKVLAEFDIKKQALKYFDIYKGFKHFRKRHPRYYSDYVRLASYYPWANKLVSKIKALSKILFKTTGKNA